LHNTFFFSCSPIYIPPQRYWLVLLALRGVEGRWLFPKHPIKSLPVRNRQRPKGNCAICVECSDSKSQTSASTGYADI
jgi:hypothetical protein